MHGRFRLRRALSRCFGFGRRRRRRFLAAFGGHRDDERDESAETRSSETRRVLLTRVRGLSLVRHGDPGSDASAGFGQTIVSRWSKLEGSAWTSERIQHRAGRRSWSYEQLTVADRARMRTTAVSRRVASTTLKTRSRANARRQLHRLNPHCTMLLMIGRRGLCTWRRRGRHGQAVLLRGLHVKAPCTVPKRRTRVQYTTC